MLNTLLALGLLPAGAPEESAEQLLQAAREGDTEARNEVIRRYTALVLRIGSQMSGRYLQVGRDEEVSVGLIGLNEAIDRYDPARGASFLTYAQLVIRRRLTDHYRRSRHRAHELPFTALETEDGEGNVLSQVEASTSLERYAAEQEAADRREEIALYTRRLQDFGIRFTDLVGDCPQHADARERAIATAKLVAQTPIMAEHLLRRKELPLKALEGRVAVSRKTLERQRRYIIAVTILLLEDFQCLRQYVAAPDVTPEADRR